MKVTWSKSRSSQGARTVRMRTKTTRTIRITRSLGPWQPILRTTSLKTMEYRTRKMLVRITTWLQRLRMMLS